MTGILLLGGHGTRLMPCTKAVNKQLLPLYNKPLFFYSLSSLINLGVDTVCIVARRQDIPYYKDFLIKPFMSASLSVAFVPQDEPLGIAHAIGLCQKYVEGNFYYTLLGDNVFVGDVSSVCVNYKKPWILTSKVAHPNKYGVLDSALWRVIEKPRAPIGNAAVTGLYHLPISSFEVIKGLKPSFRGEYEIADVINHYMQDDQMRVLKSESYGLHWFDCGNFDDILECASLIKSLEGRTGVLFGDFIAELAISQHTQINFNYIAEYLQSLKNEDYANKFKKTIHIT
jgi:glucose-1-phosphate thymidylyltransferase|tara:strand:- start:8251 stop:9105 length:855 start_codon:yes stop_codon:yes gene_type:complete